MGKLKEATDLVKSLYGNRTNKSGELLANHAVRVMKMGRNVNEKIAGTLYQVVKHNLVSVRNLEEMGFDDEITTALVCLKTADGEDFDLYLKRLSLNPLATAVMVHDLSARMDIRRYTALTEKETTLMNVYLAAYRKLKPVYDDTKPPVKDRGNYAKARKQNPNAYKKWTEEDDLKLEKLFSGGAGTDALCEEFGRNKGAVEARILKLGLPEKCGREFVPTDEFFRRSIR